MDWSELTRTVIARGAPILGTALGGPLGAAAGQVLAEALGVNGAGATELREALREPADSALAEAETRWIEMVRAESEATKTTIERTHDTIVAEMNAGDAIQRWWRPLYALELTAECAVLWASVIHGFWRGDIAAFNALAAGAGLAVAYWGFRFGVLGIYVSGRTREKLAAGAAASSMLPLPAARPKRQP